jgi:hypothetical protein
MEMHQALWQQLDHPNKNYHIHLAATYTAQLQHNHGKVTEVDHDMLPATDSHMTAARPNTADLDMAMMDKIKPTPTDQQDSPVDMSTDWSHQQWDPPQPRPTRGSSTGYTRDYCEEKIHQCPIMYEQPFGKREVG